MRGDATGDLAQCDEITGRGGLLRLGRQRRKGFQLILGEDAAHPHPDAGGRDECDSTRGDPPEPAVPAARPPVALRHLSAPFVPAATQKQNGPDRDDKGSTRGERKDGLG